MISKKGFTLIELVIVIAITGMLFALAAQALIIFFEKGYAMGLKREEEIYYRRLTATNFARDARRVKDLTAISQASADQFTFYDIYDWPYSYYASGNYLIKEVSGNAYILADNLRSLSFAYFDQHANLIATPLYGPGVTTNIRIIGLTIIADYEDLVVTSELKVALRNLL